MKKKLLLEVFTLVLFSSVAFGQDIMQNQVPSVVVNSFQQAFPKAFDVEWEMDGSNFKVEFEKGLVRMDHSTWYDKTGKLIRHREEISKGDLPKKVLSRIKTDFKNFRIEDVKKNTEGNNVNYTLELDAMNEEWKVTFDMEGNVLSKIAD